MTYCSDCNAVEQGVVYADDDEDQQMPICARCGMEETMVNVDEDYGKDE